ncbi:hypothetical protein AcW2_006504 [Taiwanofungus camphoratus]|nr:hypothetical protein AcW2_006504 [Antrodia cinnamomea]
MNIITPLMKSPEDTQPNEIRVSRKGNTDVPKIRTDQPPSYHNSLRGGALGRGVSRGRGTAWNGRAFRGNHRARGMSSAFTTLPSGAKGERVNLPSTSIATTSSSPRFPITTRGFRDCSKRPSSVEITERSSKQPRSDHPHPLQRPPHSMMDPRSNFRTPETISQRLRQKAINVVNISVAAPAACQKGAPSRRHNLRRWCRQQALILESQQGFRVVGQTCLDSVVRFTCRVGEGQGMPAEDIEYSCSSDDFNDVAAVEESLVEGPALCLQSAQDSSWLEQSANPVFVSSALEDTNNASDPDCSGTCIQKDKVSFMNTSQMGFWSTTPKKCRHEQATEASSSHHDVVEVDSPPFPPLLLNSSDGANSHVGLTTESEGNPDNLSEMIHGFDDELLFRTDIYDPRSLSSARSPVFSFRSGSLVIMPLDGPRSNPESTSELLQESMTIPPHDIESPRFRDEIVRSEGSGLSSAYRPGHVPQVRSDARQVGAVQIAQQHYLFACNQPQSATSSPSSGVFEVHNNATMNTTVDLTAQERDSRKRSLRAELPDEILRFPRNSYDKPRRLLISPTLGVLCVTMRGSVLGVQDSQSRRAHALNTVADPSRQWIDDASLLRSPNVDLLALGHARDTQQISLMKLAADKVVHVGSLNRPVQKEQRPGVSAICSMLEPSMFVTGGYDHMVHLWNVMDDISRSSHTLLKIKHASLVQSLLTIRDTSHKLISAGADCTVHFWDLSSERVVNTLKTSNSVYHVHRALSPFCTLMEVAHRELQFEIRDHRLVPEKPVQRFGYSTIKLRGRYSKGDTKYGMFACGDGDGSVRVWDLRKVTDNVQIVRQSVGTRRRCER